MWSYLRLRPAVSSPARHRRVACSWIRSASSSSSSSSKLLPLSRGGQDQEPDDLHGAQPVAKHLTQTNFGAAFDAGGTSTNADLDSLVHGEDLPYGGSGEASVLDPWPFLVRKSLAADFLAVAQPTWVFGAAGSGARSAMRNAIGREVDFDFGAVGHQLALVQADEGAVATSSRSQSSSEEKLGSLAREFVLELSDTIPVISNDDWRAVVKDHTRLFDHLANAGGAEGAVDGKRKEQMADDNCFGRQWLTLAARIALGEAEGIPTVRRLRAEVGEQGWDRLKCDVAETLKQGRGAVEQEGKDTTSTPAHFTFSSWTAVWSAVPLDYSGDKVELLVDVLSQLPPAAAAPAPPASSSNPSASRKRAASTSNGATPLLLANLRNFLILLRETRFRAREQQQQQTCSAPLSSKPNSAEHLTPCDGSGPLEEQNSPAQGILALARCDAVQVLTGGEKFLHLIRTVFHTHPVLLHNGGDGMRLLEAGPERLISVPPLTKQMVQALCEQILQKEDIPLVVPKKQSENPEFHLEYWDFAPVFEFFGGHTRHLRLFMQELVALCKDQITSVKPTDLLEQDKIRHELQCPKNLTHELLRNARHQVLAQDTLRTEARIRRVFRSVLSEGREGRVVANDASRTKTPEADDQSGNSKFHLMESLRAIVHKIEADGYVLVREDFNLKNRVLLALLEERLLIPMWEPTRLESPNKYTLHCLRIWLDFEYSQLSLKERVAYNVNCWKHRDGIQQSFKRIAQ